MKRLLVLSMTLAACGGGGDRATCARNTDCAAGEYCARTPDGDVCWPDAVAPVVSAVKVTCAAPCPRDGLLHVEATVEDDKAVGEVGVTLDLDPARRVPMSARGGRLFGADLRLEEWPFPAFERPVVATVTAIDGARNTGAAEAATDQRPLVTRLRWIHDAGVPMTSPAVMNDGTAVVGLSATSGQVLAVKPDGTKAWGATVGSAFVSVPPAVSEDAVWVGTQSGGLYAVAFGGTVLQMGCSPAAPVAGPVAVAGRKAISSSQSGVIVVADGAGFCNQVPTGGPATYGPAISAAGHVLVPAAGYLHSYTLPSDGVLRADWTGIPPAPLPPATGDAVNAPMAVDAADDVWTLALNGTLNRTTPAAATSTIATIGAGSAGGVVLADGSLVISTSGATVERVGNDTAPWRRSAPMNGTPTVPLVLGGTVSALLVPTSTGRLYAIQQADGEVFWSVKLSATEQPLQPANIHGVAGARTATAYVAGADGKLYAVIVDGQLDASAPWPKAFHDPRNTSNAGTKP